MKKAAAVLVIMQAILVLCFSSANAVCKMPVYGKVVGIMQEGGLVTIDILREGTTNSWWSGIMSWGNPTLSLYGTALATGVRVQITGDYGTCPAPVPYGGGGSMIRVGNIIASTFTK